jgi:ABC-type antimicrobial peptide transport system permease subunit
MPPSIRIFAFRCLWFMLALAPRVPASAQRSITQMLGLGMPIAMMASRAITSLLFGVDATSPVVLGATAGLTLLVGLAAAIVPMRRVARVNAMDALRAE